MKTLILCILLTGFSLAQEINCKVTVNLEGLPILNREIMKDFPTVVEDYINKTKFTDEIYDGEKIECTITIFFTGASDETNYSAQLFVGSRRPVYQSQNSSPMLMVMDNNWNFSYSRGQNISRNESVYDPITSFLDFYALLIIGYDMDSFDQLSGSQCYSQAMNIVNLGQSSRFSNGWQRSSGSYSRRNMIEDLLNEKYRQFREGFYNYHFNGIDLYSSEKNKAQDNIASLVFTLDKMRSKIDINSILIKSFFDSKHGEIIDHLRDYPNKEVFEILRKVDPAHSSKYDEAVKS